MFVKKFYILVIKSLYIKKKNKVNNFKVTKIN